jgi:tetratricopeptide (TPR) repeat protein
VNNRSRPQANIIGATLAAALLSCSLAWAQEAPEADSEGESEAAAEFEVDTEPGAEPEAEPEVEPEVEPEAGVEPDAGVEPEAGADVAAEAGVETELEAELEIDADAEPAYVPVMDQVNEYLFAIDRAEANSNAYSPELADLYLGLGQSLLQRQEFENAREAFQQGMQVVRVNFGLSSPQQSDYLFWIANIESELGNRKEVDQVMENIYLINARNYGADAPEMIPVLDRMLSWYTNHRPLEAPESRFADMERAELLAGRKAGILEKHYGLDNRQTAQVYRQIGQINWQTASYVLSQGMSIERGLVVAVGSPPQNPNARAVSVKSLVGNGRDAFAKVADSVNADPSRSQLERAEAIAQLGDWDLAFGRRRTAAESYEKAYALLAEDPDYSHLADAYFSAPTPVRFMQEDLLPRETPVGKTSTTVKVVMTVTEGGRPLNVDIIEPPESFPADHVRLMKRMVSNMRFRPMLSKGSPVEAEDHIWYLPLDEAGWSP